MTQIRPLIRQEEIAAKVASLGRQLSVDYEGQDLTVLGILTGSIIFVADLMRQVSVPHQLGLIQASSYRGAATTSGTLHLNLDFVPDLAGRNVLLVDDIFDTGKTIRTVASEVKKRGAGSVRSAVLLWKKARTEGGAAPDYFCFEIPDQFVVGYGLDHDGQYRHLPDVCVVEETTSP